MPKQILQHAIDIIGQRGETYGGIENSFNCAAKLASLKLDCVITPYMVAIILESVKDARRAASPDHFDSHLDGINYRAFAWALRNSS